MQMVLEGVEAVTFLSWDSLQNQEGITFRTAKYKQFLGYSCEQYAHCGG